MKWNSQDYGGLEKVSLPSAAVWKPDVYIHDR